jgi:CRP-like cAMP-binding protein
MRLDLDQFTLNQMPDISHFRLAPLFRDIDRATLTQIAAHAHWKELDTGESLFTQGESGKQFFLIKTGTVKLYLLSESGQEHTLEILGRERLFAEAVMFMGGCYPVNAIALEPCRLIAFDSAYFRHLLQDQPKLCLGLLAALSRQLHTLLADIDRIALQSGSRRLAQYLLTQLAQPATEARVVVLNVNKQEIASLLDIRPETFSRILARLAEDGLIRVQGDSIVLESPERLKRI